MLKTQKSHTGTQAKWTHACGYYLCESTKRTEDGVTLAIFFQSLVLGTTVIASKSNHEQVVGLGKHSCL